MKRGKGEEKKKERKKITQSLQKPEETVATHGSLWAEKKKKTKNKKRQGGRQMLCFVLSYLGSGSRAGALHCADNRDKLVNTNW